MQRENCAEIRLESTTPALSLARLADIERGKFQIRDTPCQTLAGLSQQVHRGRAEQQKLSRRFALADSLVNDPAQYLHQLRRAMNLIEHHETAALRVEITVRVGEFFLVDGVLQVEIQTRLSRPSPVSPGARPSNVPRNGLRERRFADLARPYKSDGGEQPQMFFQACGEQPRNHPSHPCNYGMSVPNCKFRCRRGLYANAAACLPLLPGEEGHRPSFKPSPSGRGWPKAG